jgi:hypothetical protein
MELKIEWDRPLQLKDASKQNMIYAVDIQKVTNDAGIYVFGRRWGKQFEALYVGKADKIRGRVKGQFNNLRLMQHLRNARAGKRILLAGKLNTKRGQRLAKCLRFSERAMIRHFLSEGHDLVNKQGVRLRRHKVLSSGKDPKRFFPDTIYLEKAKGE